MNSSGVSSYQHSECVTAELTLFWLAAALYYYTFAQGSPLSCTEALLKTYVSVIVLPFDSKLNLPQCPLNDIYVI